MSPEKEKQIPLPNSRRLYLALFSKREGRESISNCGERRIRRSGLSQAIRQYIRRFRRQPRPYQGKTPCGPAYQHVKHFCTADESAARTLLRLLTKSLYARVALNSVEVNLATLLWQCQHVRLKSRGACPPTGLGLK